MFLQQSLSLLVIWTYFSIDHLKTILKIIYTFVVQFSGTNEELLSLKVHILCIIQIVLIILTIPTGRVHIIHIVDTIENQ